MKCKFHPTGKPGTAYQPAASFRKGDPPAKSLLYFLLLCEASRQTGNRPIVVLIRELDHFPAPQPAHIANRLKPQFHAIIHVIFVARELPRRALRNSCRKLP